MEHPDWQSIFDSHFWPNYPRKRAKLEARKAWNKIDPRDPTKNRAAANEILDLLEDYLENEWAGRELRHIPHPATWLRMEEWSFPPAQSSAAPRRSCVRGAVRPTGRLLPWPGDTTGRKKIGPWRGV